MDNQQMAAPQGAPQQQEYEVQQPQYQQPQQQPQPPQQQQQQYQQPPQQQYQQPQQPYPQQPMYPHAYPVGQPQYYMPPQTEEFILLPKELHLGQIKETFRRGAVITHDITNNKLIIDGRTFDNARDMDVLKRQAIKYPHKPWIIPFTEEARAEVMGLPANPQAVAPPPKQEYGDMPVIQHDTSEIPPIPIGHTRVSANMAAEVEARRQAVQAGAPMEIIRGDEGVEERIARLEGKNDIGSIAERARLKAGRAARMPIVHDDSLGHMAGSKSASLNAGQPLPSREQAEAAKGDAVALADSRKQQVASARQAAGIMVQPYPAQPTASQGYPQQPGYPQQQPQPPQQQYQQPPQQQAPPPVDVPDAHPQGVPGVYDEVTPLPMNRPAPPAPPAPTADEQRITSLESGMGELQQGMGQIMGMLQNMQQPAEPVLSTTNPEG